MNLQLCICDELNSLIRGLLITIASNNNECYYWSQCIDGKNYLKREYALHNTYPFIVSKILNEYYVNINYIFIFVINKYQ